MVGSMPSLRMRLKCSKQESATNSRGRRCVSCATVHTRKFSQLVILLSSCCSMVGPTFLPLRDDEKQSAIRLAMITFRMHFWNLSLRRACARSWSLENRPL